MKRIALCCALALCLALTACAPALPPQPTLEELLAEVNAAHQAVQRPEVDAEQYLREGPDQETVARFTEGELTAFNSDAELTAAQAAEDVEYLFEAFRTLYGPYEYFGGDETFGAHKAELLARLAEKDSWTAAEVQDLLLEGLRFFQDGHFNINGGKPNLPRVPFFFREAAFYKTEEGGYIREDGRRAASAAETFVDMAHNVENVLFIGENTSGAQVTSAAYHIQLPHSKCVVTMGHGLFVVPQDWDYYEELRGYEPDIWVPAAEAEELAVKWMKNLGAVGAPQE